MKIVDLKAREILDSRGNPTIEVDVILENGIIASASVASGASTGSLEALELRDGDKSRYLGKGVLKAIANVIEKIKPVVVGMEVDDQKVIDETLIKLDGTENKENLGANAILGVSLACLKARAILNNNELYEEIGEGIILPRPMMNIINGGAHADNNIDFQEFMIVPNLDKFTDNLRAAAETFHNLKKLFVEAGFNTGVGDEGGFAPNIGSTKEALDYILKAITNAGYTPGKDINIAFDCAATEFYKDGLYNFEGNKLTSDQMIDYFEQLIKEYPVISIEDGLSEDDYEGWINLNKRLGDKIQLVGDDLFVTNPKLLARGIKEKWCNAILIKLNQIGTVTETLEAINMAQENGYGIVVSHRSGETEDTYIADLAVGTNAGQIKTGSVSRSERIAKYNRLLRIEENI